MKKGIRNFAFVLFMALMIQMLPFSARTLYAANKTGFVNHEYLNLRADATTASAIIIKLTQNDSVEILQDLGGWYEVNASHNGSIYHGFVSTQYITIVETIDPGSFSYDYVGYVTNTWMNLRSEPNTGCSVVVQLNCNDRLFIQDYSDGWYLVVAVHDGKYYRGYAFEDYVMISGSLQADTDPEEEEWYVGELIVGIAGYVNYETLNLRTLPTIESRTLMVLDRYDVLSLLGYENGWYKVIAYHEGFPYDGYVSDYYVTEGYPSVGDPLTGYVNSSGVNLRADMSTSSEILVELSVNDVVVLEDYIDCWYYITVYHNGVAYKGYVYDTYVSFDGPVEGVEDDTEEEPGEDDPSSGEEPEEDDPSSGEEPGEDDPSSGEEPGEDDPSSGEEPGEDDPSSGEEPGEDDPSSGEEPGEDDPSSGEEPGEDDPSSGEEPGEDDPSSGESEDPGQNNPSENPDDPEIDGNVVGFVDHGWLNLRTRPTTSSDVVIVLARDDKLLIGEYANGWYQVIAYHLGEVYEGYVSGMYVGFR